MTQSKPAIKLHVLMRRLQVEFDPTCSLGAVGESEVVTVRRIQAWQTVPTLGCLPDPLCDTTQLELGREPKWARCKQQLEQGRESLPKNSLCLVPGGDFTQERVWIWI